MAKKQKIDINSLIPSNLRNETNTTLISNLFNRFLSEEESVFISGRIGKPAESESEPEILSPDLDRNLNAIIPAIYTKTGTEESAFTFDDLYNKLKALGCDVNNLKATLAEQNYNFSPPINLDKFVNYSNYYWYVPPGSEEMPWNLEGRPEYYVHRRPGFNATQKLPVRLATTRDIKLYARDREPETITITFVNADQFTMSGSKGALYTIDFVTQTSAPKTIANVAPGGKRTFVVAAPNITDGASGGYGVDDINPLPDPLFTFDITRGTTDFVNGDTFKINITYFSGQNEVSFTNANGVTNKGFISNILPRQVFMYIDGVQVREGDTVLVWQQNDASENGVYVVKGGSRWVRAPGYDEGSYFPLNSVIYVSNGASNGQYLFTLIAKSPELLTNGNFDVGTGWNLSATWSISGGALRANASISPSNFVSQPSIVVVGKSYEVVYTISSISSGAIRIASGTMGYTGPDRTTAGTYREIITPTMGNTGNLSIEAVNGPTTAVIDNISTREVIPNFFLNNPANGQLIFNKSAATGYPQVSDWQIFNNWLHRDLVIGLNLSGATQAACPIIEYDVDLELNHFVDTELLPVPSGNPIEQRKTKFNQIPQFNLYRHNGVPANKTSGIFYYAEDPNYPINPDLQRRVKTTSSGDFLFGLSIEDEMGRMLYYRKAGGTQNVWYAGNPVPASSPAALTPKFEVVGSELYTNYILHSSNYTQGAWSKSNVTIVANTIAAPDGTMTASKLKETVTGSVNHSVGQAVTVPANAELTFSVYVKAENRGRVLIQILGGLADTSWINLDLSSGQINDDFPLTTSVADIGNGWWRVALTVTKNASAGTVTPTIYSAPQSVAYVGTSVAYNGDGSSGIYIWGAQLEYASEGYSGYIPTAAATASTILPNNKGTLIVSSLANIADVQTWKAVALSPTQFKVTGTRSGEMGIVDTQVLQASATPVLTSYQDEISFYIKEGVVPFEVGDTFTVNVTNKAAPRYVKKLTDGSVVNIPGGPAADTLGEGVWLTPRRMFENLERELSTEIAFGDMIDHVRNIIKSQNGFEGSSFGSNNFRNLASVRRGFGGHIREYADNFPLLVSMLIQPDISPLGVLDFAERQYSSAISSIDQFLFNDLAGYLATAKKALALSIINANDSEIQKLLVAFKAQRHSDQNLSEVFRDTTANMTYWPVTLPMIGLLPRVQPGVIYDSQIRTSVIIHHDGHSSALVGKSFDFDKALVDTIVTRSDGTKNAGSYTVSAPTTPYAGYLWLNSSTQKLFMFDVVADTTVTPTAGSAGQFWYKRSTNTLYEWIGAVWTVSADPLSSRWVELDTATIRNSLVLSVENELYNSVHPEILQKIDLSLVAADQLNEIELAKYSTKYQYDTYATNYIAADPFTWNYSQAGIPGVPPGVTTWFRIYELYFGSFGLPSTYQPNLEPWKLLGYPTKPVGWDATHASTGVADETKRIPSVRLVLKTSQLLSGVISIGGYSTQTGDRILVNTTTAPTENGIWIAGPGAWTRSADILESGTTVTATGGLNARTTWVIISPVGIVNPGVDSIVFDQVRLWKRTMWDLIQATHPTLKLCVNHWTDELLPPYVSTSMPEAVFALINSIPFGANAGYIYGDMGPVETVWRKSIEYYYGLARVWFKKYPLEFLTKTWGDTYVSAPGQQVKLLRETVRTPAPKDFLLHGEPLHYINERTPITRYYISNTNISASDNCVVKFVVSHVENNFVFFYAYIDGVLKGIVEEGIPFTLVDGVVDFRDVSLLSLGIPFVIGDTYQFTFKKISTTTEAEEIDSDECGCAVESETLNSTTSNQIQRFDKFIPAKSATLIGVGQWFTNLLRYSYLDTDVSGAANAFRGWDVRLSHRIGALIRNDTLVVKTDALGILPNTAYDPIIKCSTSTDSKWISALRIQLIKAGTKKLTSRGTYIPDGDGSDWVFRIETYNNEHPTLEYYLLDTASSFTTFNALKGDHTKAEWRRYQSHVSLTTRITPFTVTGIQNVINVIFGYIDRLEELGWLINQSEHVVTDAETGRNLDWQLEVEKFVNSCYSGLAPGQAHLLNPFIHALWLDTPIGLMSKYSSSNFIDVNSAQAVYDVLGAAVPISRLKILRSDEHTVTYSDIPIFSARAFIDEFEHLILFHDKISEESDSPTLFNSFLGKRIDSAVLSYTRQDAQDRKPNFKGFFLIGNEVKRNITSSTDAIADYYDAAKSFNNAATATHAMSLLGFNSKQHFKDFGISDATQFNFWRGLIQAKGTTLAIDAFVNIGSFSNASVDEYWAYKLASYGDGRDRNFPEIKIEVADCLQRFTKIQFYDANDSSYEPTPLFLQIEQEDDSRWFSIDDLGNGFDFPAQKISTTIVVVDPGYYFLSDIFHNSDGTAPTIVPSVGAKILNASLVKITEAGTYTITGYTWANQTKFSPIKLFNYKEETLDKDICLWHPAIGIHAYEPLDIINTILPYDPAAYNVTRQTTNNPNYIILKPWGKREVGRVWWDTSNLGYVPYYDAKIFPNLDERLARWGSLAEWASVNLYEWIESSIPPSEYDAVAIEEEGKSEIPAEIRASGKAALKQLYKRERVVSMRPIAWSKAGIGSDISHPSFGPAFFQRVYVVGSGLYIETGRCVDVNLTPGRHFAGWVDNKPVGEVVIDDGDFIYDLGSSIGLSVPDIRSAGIISGLIVRPIENGRLGEKIGALTLSSISVQINEDEYSYYLRMADGFGVYEDVAINDWIVNGGLQRRIKFELFGLQLDISRAGDTTLVPASTLAGDIAESWIDAYVREGVRTTDLISLSDFIFVNDPEDPLYFDVNSGWKTWEIPTQDELDDDLLSPRNTWLPYVGDLVIVPTTSDLVLDMLSNEAELNLKNGIVINRYQSSWTEWKPQRDVKLQSIGSGTAISRFPKSSFIDLSTENIDVTRLSIYANGIQLSPNTYVVSGVEGQEVVEIINILPEGTKVLLVYRAYQPTDSELAFDPEIEDNPFIQTQYKYDYQYSVVDVRNEAGAITSAKYYFWVQDKTVVLPNKSMSLVQAKNLLAYGPPQFAAFGRLNEADESFDSCVIAGLNSLVTNNDSYKLRFQRNYTLLDDPEQMNLKNVHTEWALLRRRQTAKIPKSLWDKLTDAACGEDIGGNPLPSQVRVDYDERNGTRARYGFGPGQILVDKDLVRETILNTILNTSLTLMIGNTVIPDYITALNLDRSDEWFKTAQSTRETLDLIWATARSRQVNEIFFETLEDALANNYEFTDIFKTSLISVYSSVSVSDQAEGEAVDGIY